MRSHRSLYEPQLLGEIGWDVVNTTSERVILRAALVNRCFVERNHFVRIDDPEGERSVFLARVIFGPFFHRSGLTTVAGLLAGASIGGYLLVELEHRGRTGRRPRS